MTDETKAGAPAVDPVRAALVELLAVHAESAGFTMSMAYDRAQFDELLERSQKRVDDAVAAARAALAIGAAPPECETEGEKRAFAYGWWKALEAQRNAGGEKDELAERTAFAVWYGKHRAGIKGQTPIEAGEVAWQERARRAARAGAVFDMQTGQDRPLPGHPRPAGVPREPLPAETAQPMFASHVGRRKWESLQGDGYRMQRIQFARSINGHERRGSIDPWGKVLWEPDGVAPTQGGHRR